MRSMRISRSVSMLDKALRERKFFAFTGRRAVAFGRANNKCRRENVDKFCVGVKNFIDIRSGIW